MMKLVFYSILIKLCYSSSCPNGFDCLFDQVCTGVPVKCPQGSYCPEGNEHVDFCPPGYFCEDPSKNEECPSGTFCPTGTVEPKDCTSLSICPAKSKKEFDLTLLVVLLIFCLLMFVLYFVQRIRNKRRMNKIELELEEKEKIRNESKRNLKLGETSPELTTVFKARAPTQSVVFDVMQHSVSSRIDIRFENLGLEITLKGKSKKIMEGVTGEFRAGEISAIMGPSGAGKSTLMKLITGKVKNTSGKVFINDHEENMYKYKKLVGYVPQEDNLLRTLSVQEILKHSARTRLPPSWTDKKKMSLVSDVLHLLKLDHIKNSVIGDEENRGISGGERKRVSIGIELVANPLILFLDEPTSGLDSSTSREILSFLRDIANQGVNVITIIHQPRFEIIEMCNQLLLLGKGGRTVFMGPIATSLTYFNTIGFPFPELSNPADHMIDIVSGRIKPVLRKADPPTDTSTEFVSEDEDVIQKLPQIWNDIGDNFKPVEPNTSRFSQDSQDKIMKKLSRKTPGIFFQFVLFFYRSFLQQIRDLKSLALDSFIQVLPGISLGASAISREFVKPPVPYEVAMMCPDIIRDRCLTEETSDSSAIQIYFIVMIVAAAGNIAGVRTFGEYREKQNYFREASSGINTVAYFVARCVFDLWGVFRNAIIFISLFCLITDPPGSKYIWFLIIFSIYFASFGSGYFFSNLMDNDKALASSVILAVALSVTSGLSPKISGLTQYWPLPIVWAISYSRWAAEALMITIGSDWSGSMRDRADAVIRDSGYNENNLALDIVMTFVIGIAWRIAAYVALRLRHRNKQR